MASTNQKLNYNIYSSEHINPNDFQSQGKNNLNNLQYSTFPENNINNNTFNNKTNLDNSKDEQENFNYIETSQSDSEDRLLIDKIINDYGYKWYTIKTFLTSIMLLFISCYFDYNPVNYYTVIRTRMNLSAEFMIFLSCLALLSRSLGAFSCGVILTKFAITRRGLIYICICSMLLNNFLIMIKYDLSFYIIFLIFGCFSAGNVDVLAVNILCESLPIFLRGSFLCLSLIGYLMSDLVNNYLINSFSYKNDINVRAIFMIMQGVFLFYCVLFYFLPLSDSARNLLLRGDHQQAFEILQKLKGSDLTEEEKAELVKEAKYTNEIIHKTNNQNADEEKNNLIKTEERNSNIDNTMINKSYFSSLKEIFSKRYLKTTIIFMVIRFIIYFIVSGNFNSIGLYLSKVIDMSDINKISGSQLFINLITIFSFPLSAVLIEIKFLGRKSSLIILAALCLIFLAFFIILNNVFYLLGIVLLFILAKSFTIITLTSESYPTRVRDIAVGFFGIIEVFGSISGIITFVLLIQKFILAPYIISFVLITVCFVLFFCIENETKNKPLDFILTEDDLKRYFSSKDLIGKVKKDEVKEVIYFN